MTSQSELNIGIFVCGMGNDGVSHEALKKKLVFENLGHNVFIIAGRLGEYLPQSGIHEIPDMGFHSSENMGLESICFPFIDSSPGFDKNPKYRELARHYRNELGNAGIDLPTSHPVAEHAVRASAANLEQQIRRVVESLELDAFVVENIFAIPMHLPAAVALGDVIRESRIPTIALGHDFYWERGRFEKSTITGLLSSYFPPVCENIVHLVINSSAQSALADPESIEAAFGARPRAPISAEVLPNFFNYRFKPGHVRRTHTLIPTYPRIDNYNHRFRSDFGFAEDDVLLLQHSRIVERKNIERSVDLLVALREARPERASSYKLVVSCNSRDEGNDYFTKLTEYIKRQGLTIGACQVDGTNSSGDVVFIGDRIAEARRPGRVRIYHYLDPYAFCDLVCYPSTYEGWGNSLGEAIQALKPVMINRYPVYLTDISRYGLDLVEIDNEVTSETVNAVLKLLEDDAHRDVVTRGNFEVANRSFGYDMAEKTLAACLDRLQP